MKSVLLVALLLVSAACRNSSVVTASYATLEEARAAGAVASGYLPEGLPRSTYEIREAHDGKTDRGWILFSFAPAERDTLMALLDPVEVSLAGQRGDVPGRIEWWPVLLRDQFDPEQLAATGLRTYKSRVDRWAAAVNWSQGRAYLWRDARGG